MLLGSLSDNQSLQFCVFHFLASLKSNSITYVHECMLSLFSRVQHCDPMGRSPPGSSVHGILPARILEWVDISYSRGSSQPRLNLCLLFWQADSLPLSHVESLYRPLQSQSNCFLHVTSLLVNLGWFSSAYCLQHKLLHVLGFQGLALPHLSSLFSLTSPPYPSPLGHPQPVFLKELCWETHWFCLFVGWLV